jgi:hypothetical protein
VRVVYVSTLEGGAPVTHLRLLAPRVAAEGVDVEVICASERVAESFRALDVSARAAPVGHKLDFRGGAALWRRLGEADLVHTQDRRAGLFGRIGGRLHRARVVHTLHGMPEEIAARVGRPEAPDPPGVSRARLAGSSTATCRSRPASHGSATWSHPHRRWSTSCSATAFPLRGFT